MKWIIPKRLVDSIAKQASYSFVGKDPFEERDTLILYDKNVNKNYYFKNPICCEDKLAYIAERKTCPYHFSKVVLPL